MNTRDLVFELELNASVETVWKLWTEAKSLESWLTTEANVEAKLGGAYELFWDPSNHKDNSTFGCKITAFNPRRLLGFEWRGPVPFADLMNVEPLPTWVVLSFEAISVNKCHLHFRHSGWGEGERWSQAKQWQMQAWQGAFKELGELAQSK